METKDKMVNSPIHYQSSDGIECIQAIEAATEELNGVEAVCTANAIKYLWRWKKKNGKQDLEKARWYINHLIEKLDKEEKVNKTFVCPDNLDSITINGLSQLLECCGFTETNAIENNKANNKGRSK